MDDSVSKGTASDSGNVPTSQTEPYKKSVAKVNDAPVLKTQTYAVGVDGRGPPASTKVQTANGENKPNTSNY